MMKDEIKKVLKMVEEKKLTAAEAEQLLEAIGPESSLDPKFLRINIIADGNTKVKVNVPISLIEIGLKLGTKIGPQYVPEMEALKDIDIKELITAIKQGARGKIVDIQSENAIVEIYAE